MMDPSETNNFEEQWKKALNEASETPPPAVWERIEARLDHGENNSIIPLWWRSPKLWYAAASILALLLVGSGLWYNNRSGLATDTPIDVATKLPSGNDENGENSRNNGVSNNREAGAADSIGGDQNIAINRATDEKSLNKKVESAKTDQPGIAVLKENADKYEVTQSVKNNRILPEKESDEIITSQQNEEPSKSGSTNINRVPGISKDVLAKDVVSPYATEQGKEAIVLRYQSMVIDLLSPVEYKALDVFMQKRYVFYKTEVQAEEKLSELKKPKEYWAGVGLMPGSFNPDVQIKEAPNAFIGQMASRQKSLTGTNEAGTSYAIQTQGGMRFSKHWSVELGLSYLQGNAKYQGGGYVLDALNNMSSNVLQDAISNLAGSKNANIQNNPTIGSGTSYNNSTLFIDVNKKVSNDYQFLQLPVQAGFTLRPDKKLSYSLLGGMMANFFLSNELESATGEMITTTASDDIYKNMNWAATSGLRFNYKLSAKWKASLTGSYQKAVSSGFKANQSLESHPSLYGVSWGVRYSF